MQYCAAVVRTACLVLEESAREVDIVEGVRYGALRLVVQEGFHASDAVVGHLLGEVL